MPGELPGGSKGREVGDRPLFSLRAARARQVFERVDMESHQAQKPRFPFLLRPEKCRPRDGPRKGQLVQRMVEERDQSRGWRD